jgi:hypothetical protein
MRIYILGKLLAVSMLIIGIYGCGGSSSGGDTPPEEVSTLANIAVKDMQIFDKDTYYILSSDNNVYEVDEALNQITKTIPLSNINDPEGFFVDLEGNIFIADTGGNRVVRLSKSSAYQQTMAFGKTGSGNGEFEQPRDVVVESKGDEQKIYVLDAGNNRVQVFNYVGAWLYAFDGSNTATGKLNNPTSMTGYYAQPLTIVDSGNGVIRTLQCSLNQDEHEVAVIKDGISSDLGKVTTNGSLMVTDKANSKVLVFQNSTSLEYDITTDKPPKIVISRDDLSLLVAYEGTAGIATLTRELDPPGSQPVDIARAFVEALIANDQDTVKALVGYNPTTIDFIYSDQARLDKAIEYYQQITGYEQTYHTTGYATVKAHLITATEELDAFFELEIASPQVVTGRTWLVTQFY